MKMLQQLAFPGMQVHAGRFCDEHERPGTYTRLLSSPRTHCVPALQIVYCVILVSKRIREIFVLMRQAPLRGRRAIYLTYNFAFLIVIGIALLQQLQVCSLADDRGLITASKGDAGSAARTHFFFFRVCDEF